jgi:hypothetical protein
VGHSNRPFPETGNINKDAETNDKGGQEYTPTENDNDRRYPQLASNIIFIDHYVHDVGTL